MQKSKRLETAKHTLKIIEQGYYFRTDGTRVSIRQAQEAAEANTQLYTPEALEILQNADFQRPYETTFSVINDTTLGATRNLLSNYSKVLYLNFASAKNPGGGFLNGSEAQEESIARATGLYPCLLRGQSYYETHRKLNTCFYTDTMIYSPNVPIFKDDEGETLNECPLASVITSAAVNAGVVRRQERSTEAEIEAAMKIRIDKMLSLTAHYQHDALVLGAWGCGVFQNEPKAIAQLFQEALLGKFHKVFAHICFAIKAKDEAKFVKPFQDLF